MAAGGGPSFESTPSWIIGAVVFVIVAISFAIEKLLSHLGHVLQRKERTALYGALQKIKEELMLMGFVSLLLAIVQNKVADWCIPEKVAEMWLPCPKESHNESGISAHYQTSLANRGSRLLAESDGASSCPQGKVPFVSLGVLHDLHYFIFVLAAAHVVNCTITVLLGKGKLSQWWKWEETIRNQSEQDNDRVDRVIDIRALTFIKERFEGVDARKRNYVYSFFKHLAGIVTRADYEAMRFGFILTHCDGHQRFNFYKYMVYAYEADFGKVVSISWYLWIFVASALSLNVAGWNIYFWTAFIPLILLLIVGTKLQQVITELAIYVAQRHSIIVGDIQIQPSDEYFWFKKPKIILMMIHIIIFMNSLGFAIFFWTLIKFKFNSCIMGDPKYTITRLAIMMVVQTICSYSTLPLYAVVTQMGSSYNKEAMLRYSNTSIHSARLPEVTRTEDSVEMTSQGHERHSVEMASTEDSVEMASTEDSVEMASTEDSVEMASTGHRRQ